MKQLINITSFSELQKAENVILIDARSGADAYDRYLSSHLEGAIHVDLDKDLSKKNADPSDGGRHPLPPIKEFGVLLGRLGIKPQSHVIVYDDKAGVNAAARFWWMLKSVGHEKVQVLDGGLNAAIKKGLPLINTTSKISQADAYPVTDWKLPLANIKEVAAAVADPGHLVIDTREAPRYKGETEPLDKIAGHIPGAVNVPLSGNLNEEGNFLSADELAKKYKTVIGDRKPADVIVHCGSGVTACHTLLALHLAGITEPSLYVGSWSEWSSSGREVAKGE